MIREALVVVALATACQGCADDSPITVTFRVVDQTGAPVTDAEVSCYGFVDFVSRNGDDYVCEIPGEARGDVNFAFDFTLDAVRGVRTASLHVDVDEPNPTVVLWEPTVTLTEENGILEVTWTPPPPAPAADWDSRLETITWPDTVLAQPATTTSVSLYAEDLEDAVVPELSLDATHKRGLGPQPALYQSTRLRIPHVPSVPASRGLACEVVHEKHVDGSTPIRETVTYAAGACPLTDGQHTALECGERCKIVGGVLDFGAEVPVRRVHVRFDYGTVELWHDDVGFDPIDNGAPLPAATTTRYVRIRDATYLSEVSVFAP